MEDGTSPEEFFLSDGRKVVGGGFDGAFFGD
jgi:hypothetical protein